MGIGGSGGCWRKGVRGGDLRIARIFSSRVTLPCG